MLRMFWANRENRRCCWSWWLKVDKLFPLVLLLLLLFSFIIHFINRTAVLVDECVLLLLFVCVFGNQFPRSRSADACFPLIRFLSFFFLCSVFLWQTHILLSYDSTHFSFLSHMIFHHSHTRRSFAAIDIIYSFEKS